MPLNDFISEVMQLLEDNSQVEEVLVKRTLAHRFGAEAGRDKYDAFFKQYNERLFNDLSAARIPVRRRSTTPAGRRVPPFGRSYYAQRNADTDSRVAALESKGTSALVYGRMWLTMTGHPEVRERAFELPGCGLHGSRPDYFQMRPRQV
jgi:hypothetical protein